MKMTKREKQKRINDLKRRGMNEDELYNVGFLKKAPPNYWTEEKLRKLPYKSRKEFSKINKPLYITLMSTSRKNFDVVYPSIYKKIVNIGEENIGYMIETGEVDGRIYD